MIMYGQIGYIMFQGDCAAAGFDHLERSCFHYEIDFASRPGYPQHSFNFVRKTQFG